MRLFVTGASGFIGSRFSAMAIEAGHTVEALVRPTSVGKLPAGVKALVGTLPYEVPSRAVQEADVIVHLAAITTADRAGESVAVNEVGTDYLLRLASTGEHRPGFLFLSTQSAHGGNNYA